MNRIAIISDIHGNVPALEAVLADIEKRGVDTVYCLGDLIGKGPEGARAIDLCREVCTVIVRGNWDDGITQPSALESEVGRWHRNQLGEARLAYLAALTDSVDLVMSGRRIRLFHASSESVYKRIYPESSAEERLAMFANTPFTGIQTEEPEVVGYGDIHVPYLLTFSGKTLFNVGSVGNPLDEPSAAYALLEGTLDSTDASAFALQLVRVPYDIERAVAVAAQSGMPEFTAYATELRTAVYRSLHASVADGSK